MLKPLAAANSLQQIFQKSFEPIELKGGIRKVNYATAHIQVSVHGFGLIKKIKVSKSVNLGTADRPVAKKGDRATIRSTPTGWKCIAIERKDRCATRTAEFGGDVVVENEVEPDTGDSWTIQQLGSLNLPDDLALPPFMPGGQLTLPSLRFPGGTTFLCGYPPCVNCTPNGLSAGMSPVISSDDTYPDGCWVWDFKVRGCQCIGNPATDVNYQISAYTPIDVSTIRTVTDGNYTYAVWQETIGASSDTWRFVVIDVSTPATPSIVGNTTVTFSDQGVGPDPFFARLGGITKIFDTVWLTIAQDDAGTGPFNPTYAISALVSIDVSTPASPTVVASTLFGSLGDQRAFHAPKAFSLGGNLYLATQSTDNIFGTAIDLVIYDVNSPAAPTEVSLTAGPAATMWLVNANSWQYVNGFVYLLRRDGVTKIDTYDITTPASPSYVGVFATGIDNDLDGQAFLDATSDRIVYTATNDGSTDNYITQIDYTTPASPAVLDTFAVGNTANDAFRFLRVCGTTYFFTAQRGTASGSDTFIRAWPDMTALPTALTVPDFQGTDMQINQTHLYMGGFASPTDGKSHLLIVEC